MWWGDERCVPPDDELSNFKLAKESLLDNLEVEPAEVHRIRGELQPADAAGELDKALDGVELDFLLLGLGPDGHCASLFPGSPQLGITDRRAVSGPAGLEPWIERVTMTMPTLQSAKRIVFVASGASKADAVARAFGGDVSRRCPREPDAARKGDGRGLRRCRGCVEAVSDTARKRDDEPRDVLEIERPGAAEGARASAAAEGAAGARRRRRSR